MITNFEIEAGTITVIAAITVAAFAVMMLLTRDLMPPRPARTTPPARVRLLLAATVALAALARLSAWCAATGRAAAEQLTAGPAPRRGAAWKILDDAQATLDRAARVRAGWGL